MASDREIESAEAIVGQIDCSSKVFEDVLHVQMSKLCPRRSSYGQTSSISLLPGLELVQPLNEKPENDRLMAGNASGKIDGKPKLEGFITTDPKATERRIEGFITSTSIASNRNIEGVTRLEPKTDNAPPVDSASRKVLKAYLESTVARLGEPSRFDQGAHNKCDRNQDHLKSKAHGTGR
jgi:hypothetical protein